MIEVSHKNQIQTDRKADKIVFHVLHSRSAEKYVSVKLSLDFDFYRWLDALQKLLTIEEPLEDEKYSHHDCENKESI